MQKLVLLGAGHAHLIVLAELARAPLDDVELVVITDSPWQYYSGMLPGLMAGHYAVEQCRIAVQPLVEAAGGRLVISAATGLMTDQRRIDLASGDAVTYDLLSVDIGSRTNLASLKGFAGHLLSVKPLESFCQQWLDLQQQALSGQLQSLAVLGGGAAGVELALAAASGLSGTAPGRTDLYLCAGDSGLLPGFGQGVRRRAERELARLGVTVVHERARVEHGRVALPGFKETGVSTIIAATGAAPVGFLADSGLAVDSQGFVLVDACHRSPSHPEVFAVGDTCSRMDRQLNRSGVHAVRAGPVLAANLRNVVSGGDLKPFVPRRYVLYLLSCGSRKAIGSYGPLTFSGAWVWRLKDAIDRGFVNRFRTPNV